LAVLRCGDALARATSGQTMPTGDQPTNKERISHRYRAVPARPLSYVRTPAVHLPYTAVQRQACCTPAVHRRTETNLPYTCCTLPYTTENTDRTPAVHRQSVDHRQTCCTPAVHRQPEPTPYTCRTVLLFFTLLVFMCWSPVGCWRLDGARASASLHPLPPTGPSATAPDGAARTAPGCSCSVRTSVG